MEKDYASFDTLIGTYGKALASRDYELARQTILAAIQANPIPYFDRVLAQELLNTEALIAEAEFMKRPLGFFATLKQAWNDSAARQEKVRTSRNSSTIAR
jgi:hypothetical protein